MSRQVPSNAHKNSWSCTLDIIVRNLHFSWNSVSPTSGFSNYRCTGVWLLPLSWCHYSSLIGFLDFLTYFCVQSLSTPWDLATWFSNSSGLGKHLYSRFYYLANTGILGAPSGLATLHSCLWLAGRDEKPQLPHRSSFDRYNIPGNIPGTPEEGASEVEQFTLNLQQTGSIHKATAASLPQRDSEVPTQEGSHWGQWCVKQPRITVLGTRRVLCFKKDIHL